MESDYWSRDSTLTYFRPNEISHSDSPRLGVNFSVVHRVAEETLENIPDGRVLVIISAGIPPSQAIDYQLILFFQCSHQN
jgi:hypothetical protein